MTRSPAIPGAATSAIRTEVSPPALSQLADPDYADAFRVATTSGHTAEQWARRALESGPRLPRRLFALVAWEGLLGFRLAPPGTPRTIAGLAVVANESSMIVLQGDSRLLIARLVMDVSDSHATFTTLVRYEGVRGRWVWSVAGHAHRALAPRVLERAAASLGGRPA